MGALRGEDAYEAWVARVIARAKTNGPLEDALVELKATWPSPKKAARQLAGQANAAPGREVRWLIGVKEDGTVFGARREELSSWWRELRTYFDGPAPQLVERVIEFPDASSLMILEFKVTHKPYVYKPEPRGDNREIPWREGTGTRSATRDEVVQIVNGIADVPNVYFLNALVTAEKSHHELHWTLNADLYIEADPSGTLVIPEKQCRGEVVSDELRITVPLERFSFHMPFGNTHQVQALPNQVVYRGPDSANLLAGGMSSLPPERIESPVGDVLVHLELWPARGDSPLVIEDTFVPTKPSEDAWAAWIKAHPGFLSEAPPNP